MALKGLGGRVRVGQLRAASGFQRGSPLCRVRAQWPTGGSCCSAPAAPLSSGEVWRAPQRGVGLPRAGPTRLEVGQVVVGCSGPGPGAASSAEGSVWWPPA